MPVWLQIVIGIFGLIGTVLGILGITAYINERMKHRAQKKNRREDEEEARKAEEERQLEEMKHQAYLNELRAIIREENETSIAPIRGRLEKLENQIDVVAAGTTDILRERLLSTYYKCVEKGYRTQYDYENVEHMHKEYVGLGGNSFVESCVKTIKELPSEAEFKAKKRASRKPRKEKKQLLVENK